MSINLGRGYSPFSHKGWGIDINVCGQLLYIGVVSCLVIVGTTNFLFLFSLLFDYMPSSSSSSMSSLPTTCCWSLFSCLQWFLLHGPGGNSHKPCNLQTCLVCFLPCVGYMDISCFVSMAIWLQLGNTSPFSIFFAIVRDSPVVFTLRKIGNPSPFVV